MAGAVILIYPVYRDWPYAQTSFLGISLQSTKEDVRFISGEPRVTDSEKVKQLLNDPQFLLLDPLDQKIIMRKADPAFDVLNPSENEERWSYETAEELYLVAFKDGKVRLILKQETKKEKLRRLEEELGIASPPPRPRNFEDRYSTPLQGVYIGTSHERLIEKFGNPAQISQSRDGLKRIYSYPQYNLGFWLAKNRVYSYGIYDPANGPLEFTPPRKNLLDSITEKDLR
ncbi:hypothetical protein MYX84_13890 [Acidobacteria bacterium AH-259-O06]|nr:hypothetical protein [Acidobacteria bacterium AH-259-O06]